VQRKCEHKYINLRELFMSHWALPSAEKYITGVWERERALPARAITIGRLSIETEGEKCQQSIPKKIRSPSLALCFFSYCVVFVVSAASFQFPDR